MLLLPPVDAMDAETPMQPPATMATAAEPAAVQFRQQYRAGKFLDAFRSAVGSLAAIGYVVFAS